MNISVKLTPKTSLEKALKKVGIEDPATITTLTIIGRVIESDIQYISENMRETLQELDLSGASFEKNELPNWIFGGSLISVTIPDSVTEIRRWAFQCCTALTSIAIPQSVTKIEQEYWGAFFRCTAAITVHPDNPIFSSENGVLFNKDKTELIAYPNIRQGNYHIPNSVTKIGNWAFSGCEDLISIIIPDTVTNIGEDAFWYHRLNIMVHPDNPVYKVVDGKIESK